MTETQPGREPEQGAGPRTRSVSRPSTAWATPAPSAQRGLGTREPTDDLSPTGYLEPSRRGGQTEAHEGWRGSGRRAQRRRAALNTGARGHRR